MNDWINVPDNLPATNHPVWALVKGSNGYFVTDAKYDCFSRWVDVDVVDESSNCDIYREVVYKDVVCWQPIIPPKKIKPRGILIPDPPKTSRAVWVLISTDYDDPFIASARYNLKHHTWTLVSLVPIFMAGDSIISWTPIRRPRIPPRRI